MSDHINLIKLKSKQHRVSNTGSLKIAQNVKRMTLWSKISIYKQNIVRKDLNL